MDLIDSHAHLYAEQFDDDREIMVQRAKEAGVKSVYLPNIDLGTVESMLALSASDPGFFIPMLGLHPTSVKEDFQAILDRLFTNFNSKPYAAIGEIGIDLYWDKTYLDHQISAFEQQIVLAKKHHLPIVIHVRDSFDEVFQVVDRQMDTDLKGIFHCFTGNKDQAKKIMDYKTFKMGIGGVITFKNSNLPEVLKIVPMEFLVLETDSPYLAPSPYRGKRNESSYLHFIAEKLAEVYHCSFEEVADSTTKNCSYIFGK